MKINAGHVCAVALLGASVFACAEATEPSTEANSAIIGGVDAQSRQLDAIGALVRIGPAPGVPAPAPAPAPSPSSTPSSHPSGRPSSSPPGTPPPGSPQTDGPTTSPESAPSFATGRLPDGRTYAAFCTATLIGDRTVVTAEHCIDDLSYLDDVAFVTGWDTASPSRIVPVVAFAIESSVTGGHVGLGSDVAVAHLARPINDVSKYTPAVLSADDIGARFGAIGYGSQAIDGAFGTRKAGSVTLRGLEGNVAELAYGSWSAFSEELRRRASSDGIRTNVNANTALLPGYEAFLGAPEGDAQACHGDSGGPLVGKNSKIHGVASWVPMTNGRTMCHGGSIYATFGPATMDFLTRELAWTDTCDGIDVKGECQADEAVRCTHPGEGSQRRLVRTDCSTFGQHCAKKLGAQVACSD